MVVLYKGEIIMGNNSGLWAMAVALISVAGSLILHFISYKKDSNTIGKVKEDTATLLPEVKNIDENTKKIREQVTEQVLPSLSQISETKKGVVELVDELKYQKRLKQETSPYIQNMDIFISGIKNIYDENARLLSELKEERAKSHGLLMENKNLMEELDIYRGQHQRKKEHDRGFER